MAGKIHTDSEALYAIRNAVAKFADEMQDFRSDFSNCFEKMNRQIEKEIKRIKVCGEDIRSDYERLKRQQTEIMDLLYFDAASDPETITDFIDKAISCIEVYRTVDFDIEDKTKKDTDIEPEKPYERIQEVLDTHAIETQQEVIWRLKDCGIEKVDFTGVPVSYQSRIADAVSSMCEAYPELKGYIRSMYIGKLRHRVLACAGPVNAGGKYAAEIIISVEEFTSPDLEHRINKMGRAGLNGKRWLAGSGIEGVVKHEMAHLLHLKMITDSYGIGNQNADAMMQQAVQKDYTKNAIVTDLCYAAIRELGIRQSDIARNLSTYGASDFGECFAEALSEYETAQEPRPLSIRIHDKYVKYRKERRYRNDYNAT